MRPTPLRSRDWPLRAAPMHPPTLRERAMAFSQSEHIRRAVAARDERPFLVKCGDWVRSRPEGGIAVLFVLAQLICVISALLWPESFRYLSEANIAVTLKAI